jgi:AraC-like DNA-binding protein
MRADPTRGEAMKAHLEQARAAGDSSLSTEDVKGPVIDCVLHVHREYELTYVASSRGTRLVGSEIGLFSEGMLSLYGPMLPHHYFSPLSESASPEWGHARVVKFGGRFGEALYATPELGGVRRMLESSALGLDFSASATEKALPLFEKLFDTDGTERLLLFVELLERLSRSEFKTVSPVSADGVAVMPDARINKALALIHARLVDGEGPSLGEAAARMSMSPSAFCRFFRRATRKSFVAYVNEMKLERACLKLLESSEGIAEICFASGFRNLSNFNRQFLKRKGVSPSRYREAFRRF